jgi:hypothetical protein
MANDALAPIVRANIFELVPIEDRLKEFRKIEKVFKSFLSTYILDPNATALARFDNLGTFEKESLVNWKVSSSRDPPTTREGTFYQFVLALDDYLTSEMIPVATRKIIGTKSLLFQYIKSNGKTMEEECQETGADPATFLSELMGKNFAADDIDVD